MISPSDAHCITEISETIYDHLTGEYREGCWKYQGWWKHIHRDWKSRDSWRFKGEIFKSAEVKKKKKSCKKVHLLLRAVLKGVLPDFPVPSALGSHINYYKITVKRKHSKLVLFLISCATQKCRGVDSLALKSTFYFWLIFRLLKEPLLAANCSVSLSSYLLYVAWLRWSWNYINQVPGRRGVASQAKLQAFFCLLQE